MTSTEKEKIYNLLKTASDCFYTYSSPDFKEEKPIFEDDFIEYINNNNESLKVSNSINQIKNENKEISQVEVLPKESSSAKNDLQEKEITKNPLTDINERIKNCKNCILHQFRKNPIPGEGVENPLVLVIGEGPYENEDKEGRPFVGDAGIMLDKMLSAINLSRKVNCYITHIVKCKLPQNRMPMIDEQQACEGFLLSQIHRLKPKIILTLGRTSIQSLLKTSQGIRNLRGQWLDHNGIPVMATYNPHALLRDESLKRDTWNDLKMVRTRLYEINPDYDKEFKSQI